MRESSIRRPLIAATVGALLALAVASVWFLRSEQSVAWMRDVTGEEDMFEAVKGTVALALIGLGGDERDLAPDVPIEHLGVGAVGVNTFLQLEADPEMVRRSLAEMRDAGVTWARQQVPWEDVEIHGKGDYEDRRNEPPRSAWEKYDRIVAAAEDHGVRLLLRLDDPPDWAYADPEASGRMGPPDDIDDYGDFVAEVVGRYCGRVRYYQIWNEPNIYPEWGERDVDPAGYAALLETAASRARAACPDVVIVSAALAQTTEAGGRNMDDLAYLQALYDAGWQESFDVLAAQAFGLWTGPTDRRTSPDRANFSRAMLAREVMVRSGDADRPVWITEMGWDSPPEDMAAPYGRADEETRARYTQAAYERLEREWPWAGPGFVWFFRRPNWEWHAQPHGYFRLIEPDWTHTPAWAAIGELGGRAPSLWRGRHGPWHPALRASGPWRDGEPGPTGQARVALPGAELQVPFHGTGARLLWSDPADLEASPAGPPSSEVPALPGEPASPEGPAAPGAAASPGAPASGDAPAPPEVTWVADGATQRGPLESTADGRLALVVDGLGDGPHDLIVRIESGQPQLEEVVVTAPDTASPLAPLWRWALLALVGAGLAGLLSALAVGALDRRRAP